MERVALVLLLECYLKFEPYGLMGFRNKKEFLPTEASNWSSIQSNWTLDK